MSKDPCLASFGTYKGAMYTTTSSSSRSRNSMTTIGEPKCLVESNWMKLMQHSVQIENLDNPDKNTIIDDWLFIDYHDRINVLVQDPIFPDQFLVINQTKYSLEGKYSLAIIGGIIEPTEEPDHAAHREVDEEMNVSCQSLVPLGRFRTDVNRGMGWVHSFLAMECSNISPYAPTSRLFDEDGSSEEVGASDYEKQQFLSLSKEELKESVTHGKFIEVQWSNTVSLALLHLL